MQENVEAKKLERAIYFSTEIGLQNKQKSIGESPQKNAVLDPWGAGKKHKQKKSQSPHSAKRGAWEYECQNKHLV